MTSVITRDLSRDRFTSCVDTGLIKQTLSTQLPGEDRVISAVQRSEKVSGEDGLKDLQREPAVCIRQNQYLPSLLKK